MTAQDLAAACSATDAAVAEVAQLQASGWRVDSEPRAWRVQGRGASADLVETLSRLSSFLSSNELIGTFGRFAIRLTLATDGSLQVTSSSGQVEEQFGVDLRDRAHDAVNGDSVAAMSLPLEWSLDLVFFPTAALEEVAPHFRWLVFRSLSDAENFLSSVPYWRIGELLPADRPTVALIHDLDPGEWIRTPLMIVTRLSSAAEGLLQLERRGGVSDSKHISGLITPESLVPISNNSQQLAPLRLCLLRIAAANAWAEIATDSTFGRTEASLEFFGLQRTKYAIPSTGPDVDEQECRETVALWAWVTTPDKSDRLMAVRQVLSLHSAEAPWTGAADVRQAAEPIFLALRSDAVAEVLRGQREVKAMAIATAQQTAALTTGMVKGAIERALASLLAIGGVVVASSTDAVGAALADQLRSLLSLALIGLALWSVCLESPQIFGVGRAFARDLPLFNQLLPAEDREQVLQMAALRSARAYAIWVSTAVPLVYLGLAVVAAVINP